MTEEKMFLTVRQLAKRWEITKENLDKRRMKSLPPEWVDIAPPGSKRPTIRYDLKTIEEYERNHRKNQTGNTN